MDEFLLQRLRTLVVFEIDTFERQLATLRSLHYPSNAAIDFIDHLAEEVRGHYQEINQVLDDFPDNPERAARGIRSQHRLLLQKLRYLNSIENAQTVRVPWSLVPSIERLGSALLPGKPLLTACTHSFNYGIWWNADPKSEVQKYAILDLPAIHKTNAFLHILVAHELFHPNLQEFFKSQTAEVMKRLRDKLNPVSRQLELEKKRFDELVEYARDIWQRALEELMCDMGCAAVFGPAALFASVMLLIGENLDELPSPKGSLYPPPRYRLREVLRHTFEVVVEQNPEHPDTDAERRDDKPLRRLSCLLNDRDFGWAADLLQEHIETIKTEVRKETDLQQIDQNPFLKLAYEEVRRSLPQAWDYVREKAKSTSRTWLATIDDIPELLRGIGSLVPPGEIREKTGDKANPLRTRAPSLSAITIAMWLCQLRDEGKRKAKPEDDELRAYHRLCRLMLKGFEDVELRLQYDSRKGPRVES